MILVDLIKSQPSPFPVLLSSNHALSAHQRSIVINDISAVLHDVAHLDQDILRLETAITELRHKHDERQGYAVKHKTLLSTIRQVPTEILAEIVIHSVEMNFTSPLVLGTVCSNWRSITLAYPQL